MKFKTSRIKKLLPDIDIQVTHNEKKFDWVNGNMGGKPKSTIGGIAAELTGDKGEKFYLVCLPNRTDTTWLDDVNTLSHEASHIVDYYLERIGEDAKTKEIRAYLQGNITELLCKKHFRWKEKKLSKKK